MLTHEEVTVIKQYEQREAAHRAEAEHQLRLADAMRRAAEGIRANPINPEPVASYADFCTCGHHRSVHIYEESRCRPAGVVCGCGQFTEAAS